MRIWLIQLGEPLPIDGDVRLYRTGVLASALVEKGHDVTWWAATFDHTHKRQRYSQDYRVKINKHYHLELLYAKGYKKNVSIKRIIYHHRMARKFFCRVQNVVPPDLILSSFPTPELSKVAVNYGDKHNIPVVIDIRDLWPDIFFILFPSWLHGLVRLVLLPATHVNKYIFRKATGIFGISKNYLQWGLYSAVRNLRETDRVFPLGYSKGVLSKKEALREKKKILNMNINPSKTIFCFFGVFGTSYDLETVVAAAKQLNQDGENQVQFVLCGDGPKLDALKHSAVGLDNVIFTGWVSRSTLIAIMDMSAGGLAPYIPHAVQSLPNKPFEYFSGGVPVLSSLRGELEDILNEHNCGITYTAGDVCSFLDALRQLYLDPQKTRMLGDNAKRLFEERFSSDVIYPEGSLRFCVEVPYMGGDFKQRHGSLQGQDKGAGKEL